MLVSLLAVVAPEWFPFLISPSAAFQASLASSRIVLTIFKAFLSLVLTDPGEYDRKICIQIDSRLFLVILAFVVASHHSSSVIFGA